MGIINRIGRQGFVSEFVESRDSAVVIEHFNQNRGAKLACDPDGKLVATSVTSAIVYAPGLINPDPPIYSDWSDIEKIVNASEGALKLFIDTAGIFTGPPYAHVPATANLDGRGRLSIIGTGQQGEAGIIIDDGGQIKNVQEWRTIVVRCSPTVRSPIVYDLSGLVVECFDATFMFGSAATLPVISAPVNSIPANSYLALLLINSAFGNSHNPNHAVLDMGQNTVLLLGIGCNLFPTSFDETISGPANASITLQRDASQPTISIPAFLGSTTDQLIDDAKNMSYIASNVTNWNNVQPKTVQAALDRIAAKLATIP